MDVTCWCVVRQGRPSAPKRVLYLGADEARARRIYERARARMRQGTLMLTDEDRVVARTDDPMVRTRW